MSLPFPPDADDISARWRAVQLRVAEAAERAGRDPGEVTIVAVSKMQSIEAISAAAAAGVVDFGENYVQELMVKQPLRPQLRWHFVGRLQRNKAKQVAGRVALIHAVDSLDLAAELSKRAGALQPVLLVVNVAEETSKSGVTVEQAERVGAELRAFPQLQWCGLMTMPPPSDDPEQARTSFRALAALRARLQDHLGHPLPMLSMGMSGDFEIAIAEGATHVRIGTAIFGARPAAATH